MARIRGRDTGPERAIALALQETGHLFECHCSDLPGKPDFVFRAAKVVVFVDGDFWHGWRFSAWRHKLSEKWEIKIDHNRRRDLRNHRRLRAMGWHVIRLWEHQIEKNMQGCMSRIAAGLTSSRLNAL
jgi:DNA mismatch endonuclease, patch repair protein